MPPQANVALPAVLVLDADQASALAIVRSLGCSGVIVTCASASPHPIAAYSRHSAGHLLYPDPLTQEDAFIAWLQDRQRSQGTELIFPVTERTVVPMNRHSDRLDRARLALAPARALEQVLDKSRTVALAQSLGVQVPKSVTLRAEEALPQLEQLEAPWGYPVVVKPARSVGQAQQGGVHLSVAYARNARELSDHVQHLLRYGEVILQEYFQGDGVGVELIASRGEVCHAFQHRRLHEVPLTGGGSSLRVSEPVAPVLLEASAQLMRALGWHGVAMVEFKFDPKQGDYRLMEINGRFWGSLPLAVAAGANFPLMLYELMCTGQVQPRAAARTGVVCRLLARDLLWLEHVLRRAGPPDLVHFPAPAQILRDCALVLSSTHHFDVQRLSDPWPGLVDVGRIVRSQWSRVTDAQYKRRLRRKAWREARAHWKALVVPGLKPTSPRQVLFLCYGNINRSALAQAHAVQTGQAKAAGWDVVSAGFHTPAERPADNTMVAVAAAKGIDLQHWRSQTLDASQVAQAELILVMELDHLERLHAEHPAARGKSFLLGAPLAAHPGATEIADPYGKPRPVYEAVADQVVRAVNAWLLAPPNA